MVKLFQFRLVVQHNTILQIDIVNYLNTYSVNVSYLLIDHKSAVKNNLINYRPLIYRVLLRIYLVERVL